MLETEKTAKAAKEAAIAQKAAAKAAKIAEEKEAANTARDERAIKYSYQRELAFNRMLELARLTSIDIPIEPLSSEKLEKMKVALALTPVPVHQRVLAVTPREIVSTPEDPGTLRNLNLNILRRFDSLSCRPLVLIFAHANIGRDIQNLEEPETFRLQEKTDTIFIPDGGALTVLADLTQKMLVINREALRGMLLLNNHMSDMIGRDGYAEYSLLTECRRAKAGAELPNLFCSLQDDGYYQDKLGIYLLNSGTTFVNNIENNDLLMGPDESLPDGSTDWYLSELIVKIKEKLVKRAKEAKTTAYDPIIMLASCSGPERSLKLKALAKEENPTQALYNSTEYLFRAQKLINIADISYADPGITTFTPAQLDAVADAIKEDSSLLKNIYPKKMEGERGLECAIEYYLDQMIPRDYGATSLVRVMHQDFLASYCLQTKTSFNSKSEDYKYVVNTGNIDIALKTRMLMAVCTVPALATRVREIKQTIDAGAEMALLRDLCGIEDICKNDANLKPLIEWLLRE